MELQRDDKEKTTVITRHGLWHFSVVLFGLCNAPVTFERLVDTILRNIRHLDDVITIRDVFEEHFKTMEEVLERMSAVNTQLSPKKWNLFWRDVKYWSRRKILQQTRRRLQPYVNGQLPEAAPTMEFVGAMFLLPPSCQKGGSYWSTYLVSWFCNWSGWSVWEEDSVTWRQPCAQPSEQRVVDVPCDSWKIL